MKIPDPLFSEAVKAIDAGDLMLLARLLKTKPQLVHDRLITNEEGYFKDPYLLWFIAENPTRTHTLPSNIKLITESIIQFAKEQGVVNLADQLSYTLALVSSGQVARKCGVQTDLINLLIDEGADPNEAIFAAVAHAERAAIEQLIKRGAAITLPVAISIHRKEQIKLLSSLASKADKQIALAVAAFYGQADSLCILIDLGVNLNEYCPVGFHSHSTPLHQAVAYGSLEAVEVLVEAGADLSIQDKIYQASPLGWAKYGDKTAIADYLHKAGAK
ncbi:MAG TPA: ankyrin repeat domain-containing protein [Cyclobacteriaceae bacterium]